MFELTDQAFTCVQPLLPTARRGKPWRDHRLVLGGFCGSCIPTRPAVA